MRAIDADLLVEKLYENEFATLCPLDEVCGVIDNVPTMDIADVVRCRDCGDWREYGEYHICEHFSAIDLPGLCKNIIFTTRSDDFCSSGFRIKRSETETEEIK